MHRRTCCAGMHSARSADGVGRRCNIQVGGTRKRGGRRFLCSRLSCPRMKGKPLVIRWGADASSEVEREVMKVKWRDRVTPSRPGYLALHFGMCLYSC